MKRTLFGVIASILPKSTEELRKALAKSNGATSLEIRMDLLPRSDLDDGFIGVVASEKRPVILAMDPHAPANGWTAAALQERWEFWQRLPRELRRLIDNRTSEVYVDWGHELAVFTTQKHLDQLFPWEKIGIDFHDFDKTPDEKRLGSQLFAMQLSRAQAFIKIVTKALKEADLQVIERLLSGKKDPRPHFVFAMGEAGKRSRMECLTWGSAATYGYVPGFGPTAPGQLSIVELLENSSVIMGLRR